MLEAVIAGIIIVGFVAAVSQNYAKTSTQDFSIRAYEKLKELDDKGTLRPYAAAGDWGSINSQVRIYDMNHSIEICDISGNCVGYKPEAFNVWVGSYIISGYQSYQPLLIKLYLW
ncbi:MAG: hypothetical protein QXN71_01815 [Candidatus Aenigmatarchaeota archaeon]